MPEYRFWPYRIVSLHRLVEHLAMIQGINVLWSVPVEIRFYLLVPLIWLAFSRMPRVALAGMLVAIVPIYARLAALGWPNFPGNELLVALPYFLGGLAISCRVAPAGGGRPWDIAFLASLAGLLLLYPEITPFFDIPGVHYWSNPACLVLVSILLITTLRSGLAEAVLGCRPFRFLGRISYGIYLLHSVVVFGLVRISFLHHRAYILLAISLVLTLIAAQLAYVLIERPARDAINRWFDRRTPQFAKQAG
jgi:peptidoglycan/LPS O-acetylase OafA/YrhL